MTVRESIDWCRDALGTGLCSWEIVVELLPLLDKLERYETETRNPHWRLTVPKVPLQGISLTQLADGYAGRAIDCGLKEVVDDIDARGDDGKPRKVVITLTLSPQGKGHVEIDVQVATKMPAYRPPTTKAKIDARAGGLIFNPDCSDNPDQLTFPETSGHTE